MGSDNGNSDEKPVHSVTLSPFNMSKYEITYAQWIKVKNWGESHGYIFNMPGDMGSESHAEEQDEYHPATDMEWYDTVMWCNALSEMEGRTPCYYTSVAESTIYRSGRIDLQNDWVKWNANGYRLPTEAEWEYACRANTITEYNFGNSIDSSDANFGINERGTTPVGSYKANAWGLYDMHGNVWEWCWDSYGLYGSSSVSNPLGPSGGSLRVLRGGGWECGSKDSRSSSRILSNPACITDPVGFRPVYTPSIS